MQLQNISVLWLLFSIVPYAIFRSSILMRDALPWAPLASKTYTKSFFSLPIVLLALECFILLTTIVALAGPYREREEPSFRQEGADIIFALDISASMQAADFLPNRLQSLKNIVSKFIAGASGHRIGLLTFARHVFVQAPLSSDLRNVRNSLKGVSFRSIDHSQSGGTAIGDALLTAGNILIRQRKQGRSQIVALITDGENNFGLDPRLAARFLRSRNIRFYIIGIGRRLNTPVFIEGRPYIGVGGVPLYTSFRDARLRSITQAGRGIYFRAEDSNVLSRIFGDIENLEKTGLRKDANLIRESLQHVAVIPLLLFLLIWIALRGFLYRRPWT